MKAIKRFKIVMLAFALTLLVTSCAQKDGTESNLSEGDQVGSEPVNRTEPLDAEGGPIISPYIGDLPKRVMLKDNVALRFAPSHDSKAYNEISYFLVTLITAVRTDNFDSPEDEDGLWGLVYCSQLDNALDNIGWVPFDDFIYYSEENKHLLSYPLQLRKGCKDLDTGEAVSWDNVLVTYEDDCAIVSWEGGSRHRVSLDDILYPDVEEVNSERLQM